MKISLKTELHRVIREAHYISTSDLERIVKNLRYKLSNAERRLRPSESPMIREVKNEKGHITGYEWIGELPIVNYRPEYLVEKKMMAARII